MKKVSLLALGACALMASGCGGMADSLGLGRNPPDEFAVVDRPPLSIPPEFDLKPPRPGAPRPQEVSMSERANKTLFGVAPSAGASSGESDAEKAVLAGAGSAQAEANIRTLIDRDSSQKVTGSDHLVDHLLWWSESAKPAVTVDAPAEAERLKKLKDKGDAPNKGATPVIEREKSGWLGL